jgi:magnesium chelatase subunit I
VRLALDVLLCFTANPEDYTARGKIITPLKDRIGSEIITHYPEEVELGVAITRQEAWTARGPKPARIPPLLAELVERIAFEARTDKRIDRRSGVSQRLPISVLENVVSNAERRSLRLREPAVVPRLADVYAALPAITGKIELEYEGELVGGAAIARELIRRAADATLKSHAPHADTDEIVMWFDGGGALQVTDEAASGTLRAAFETVPGLLTLVIEHGLAIESDDALVAGACELVLEALVARRKISRNDAGSYGRAPRDEPRRRRGGGGGDEPMGMGGMSA